MSRVPLPQDGTDPNYPLAGLDNLCHTLPMTKRLSPLKPLSPAELELFPLLAEGLSYKAMGDLLGVSEWTVVGRVRSAAKKLPGTLPMRQKCELWYRGGNKAMLRV